MCLFALHLVYSNFRTQERGGSFGREEKVVKGAVVALLGMEREMSALFPGRFGDGVGGSGVAKRCLVCVCPFVGFGSWCCRPMQCLQGSSQLSSSALGFVPLGLPCRLGC